jgi:hypothetical protein
VVAGSVGSVAAGLAEPPVRARALVDAPVDTPVDSDVDGDGAAVVVVVPAPVALLDAGAGRVELADAAGFGVGGCVAACEGAGVGVDTIGAHSDLGKPSMPQTRPSLLRRSDSFAFASATVARDPEGTVTQLV